MQLAVSKNMLESLKVPEFRVAMTIRTDALDALYKKLKPKGVTMTCLLGKACGAALAKHPIINAGMGDEDIIKMFPVVKRRRCCCSVLLLGVATRC